MIDPNAKPEYHLTDEYREEDGGQQLPKNRIIKKVMVQDYHVSYQDIHRMLAGHKKSRKALDGQQHKLDLEKQEADQMVDKWQAELEAIEAAFPELKDAEGIISPIQPDDIGADEGGEAGGTPA